MQRVWLLQFALILAVVVAGCGELDRSAQSPSSTLTPAAVPESTAVAPGVIIADNQASVNADRLLAADTRIRANTTYRLVRNVTVTGNGWTTRVNRTRAVAANQTFERMRATGSGQLGSAIGRSQLWRRGDQLYVRTYDRNGRLLASGRLPTPPSHYRLADELRGRLLTGGRFEVDPTATGVILRSSAVSLTGPPVPFSLRDRRNVTARLVISEKGLVRAIRVRYDATFRNESVMVRISHRLTDIGNTSVVRPNWAD